MSQKLDQIEKELAHKSQKSKTFIPDLQLLELADQIRDLKSEQIRNLFTDGDGRHRCVMGALMVEKYGVEDSGMAIRNYIPKIPFLYERSNKWIYWNLTDTLASLNNGDRSFGEIADWVELQAFRYGEWK